MIQVVETIFPALGFSNVTCPEIRTLTPLVTVLSERWDFTLASFLPCVELVTDTQVVTPPEHVVGGT